MKLILLGPPGAGKGTQAEFITKRYGIVHIATGNMLRSEIAAGSELGMMAKSIIDEGGLVPDDIIIAMVKKRIAGKDCENGFLLDGFPRTIVQADALGKIAEIDAVLNIDVDSELIVERISSRHICPDCGRTQSAQEGETALCEQCGVLLVRRADDAPESVRRRLEVYAERTMPLINYYTERDKLVPIDGARAIAEVSDQIFGFIDGLIVKATGEDYSTDGE